MEIAVLALGCFWGQKLNLKLEGITKQKWVTAEEIMTKQIMRKFVQETPIMLRLLS